MPSLTDAKIAAIADLREAGFSKTKVAEATGTSRNSVRKYEPDDVEGHDDNLELNAENVVAALSDGTPARKAVKQEFIPEDHEASGAEGYTGPAPGESPLKDDAQKDLRLRVDYSQTGPGEFIDLFFDDLGVGVRSQFVELQARRAKRRGEIPDEDKMKSDLREMSSGISNAQESQYIAEEYWAEAEQYLAEADAEVFRGAGAGGESGGGDGGFVTPGAGDAGEGSWVQIPGQGTMYGTFTQGPNGEQVFQPMSPPGNGPPGAQMGMGGGGQPQRNDQVREELRALREDLREVAAGQNSGQGLTDSIQKIAEIQNALDEIGQGTSAQTNQLADGLREELQRLRREVREGGGGTPASDDPRDALIRRAMESDDVSSDDLMALFDKIDGDTDPEIRKAEIDRELEMKRMQQKNERTEKVMDAATGLVEQFGKGLGEAISSKQGGDDNGGGQPRPQSGGAPSRGEPEVATPSPPEEGEPVEQAELDSLRDAASEAGMEEGDIEEALSDGAGVPGAGTPGKPSSDPRMWECPACGSESPQNPGQNGVACPACDFSIMPCPDCQAPVEIPPASEVDRGGCPGCGEPLMDPGDGEDQVACVSCEWVGSYSENAGETVTCESCGSEHPVQSEPEESSY